MDDYRRFPDAAIRSGTVVGRWSSSSANLSSRSSSTSTSTGTSRENSRCWRLSPPMVMVLTELELPDDHHDIAPGR